MRGLLVLVLLLAPTLAAARAVLWQDPGSVRAKDFTYGPGGRAALPRPPYRFVKEITSGASPKVMVRDASRRVWIVKFGPEVHSDTFVTRLAWALGYYASPAHFVPRGKIRGAHELFRTRRYIDRDGDFRDARFKLITTGLTYLPESAWRWDQGPFAGSRELSGLKILTVLTSNWDAKDSRDRGPNTAMYRRGRGRSAEYIYALDDWGAAMGRWGNLFTREKWDCEGFRDQTRDFVEGVKYRKVGWGFDGTHEDDIADGVPVSHVRWFMQYLGSVSDAQIRAGLRASGADRHEVECFTGALRARIRQMQRIAR
jgi:hypothetical protein